MFCPLLFKPKAPPLSISWSFLDFFCQCSLHFSIYCGRFLNFIYSCSWFFVIHLSLQSHTMTKILKLENERSFSGESYCHYRVAPGPEVLLLSLLFQYSTYIPNVLMYSHLIQSLPARTFPAHIFNRSKMHPQDRRLLSGAYSQRSLKPLELYIRGLGT